MATRKSNSKNKSSKKKTNGTLLTMACCVLAILVMIIAFMVKKDKIITNLKETAFFERVFGKTPEFVSKHETAENKNVIEDEKENIVTLQINDAENKSEKKTETVAENKNENQKQINENKNEVTEQTAKKEENKTEVKEEPKKKVSTDLQLCFVIIDGDGSVTKKIIKRTVDKNDSPLVTAINELIKGPDSKKSTEKNCMSLIPAGTKLLSAKVQNGIAYLSFNEAFEINPYGVEGYINQLMQVVYTATSFSTVNSVQFLIEGEKVDYLGSEGQWIGTPLSRNSF